MAGSVRLKGISMRRQVFNVAFLGFLLEAGCATTGPRSMPGHAPAAVVSLPDSVHWFRDAAEQKAIYLEVYREAARSARTLAAGLPTGSWGVILDIDETILDNSDYQKQQALVGQGSTPDSWNAW